MLYNLSTMKPVEPVKLEAGMRVRYTGDMANASGRGVIVEVGTGPYADIGKLVLDDGREICIDGASFSGGPGCRFFVAPGLADAEEIAALLANAAIVAAKAKADKDAEKNAFSAEVERLKAEYPNLEIGNGPVVAAKNLRKLLKAAFPGVKMSVTTSKYSGGNNVTVRWTDGPTTAAVEEILDRFDGGSFSGMDDSYTYCNTAWNSLFGSARYTFASRSYSDALVAKAIEELKAEYPAESYPTIEDYNEGRAWNTSPVIGARGCGPYCWAGLINEKCSGMEG
jgi:hypothetical protein